MSNHKLTNTLAVQPRNNDDESIMRLLPMIHGLLMHKNQNSQHNLYRLLMCISVTLNDECLAIGDKNDLEYEKFHELQSLVSELAIKCDEFEIREDA